VVHVDEQDAIIGTARNPAHRHQRATGQIEHMPAEPFGFLPDGLLLPCRKVVGLFDRQFRRNIDQDVRVPVSFDKPAAKHLVALE